MSYNNVDKSTGNLIPVAGATLYADLPVGSWVKNDMGTIPYGFLKEGDPISQSEYPDVYAKYGSTVPYKADKSELSEWETSDFANNTDKTMPYDGVGMITCSNDTEIAITVNGVVIGRDAGRTTYSNSKMFFEFKKNDVIKFAIQNGSIVNQKVAYYKKSLILKAKSTGAPTDIIEGVKDALCSYSTEEKVIGTWIDGKPIYRKVLFNNDKTQYVLGDNTINISMLSPNEAEEVIKFDVMIHSVSGNDFITGDSSWLNANCLWNRFRIDPGQTNITSRSNDGSYYIRSIVLEYTKTAD